jgi:hypothetical protein
VSRQRRASNRVEAGSARSTASAVVMVTTGRPAGVTGGGGRIARSRARIPASIDPDGMDVAPSRQGCVLST